VIRNVVALLLLLVSLLVLIDVSRNCLSGSHYERILVQRVYLQNFYVYCGLDEFVDELESAAKAELVEVDKALHFVRKLFMQVVQVHTVWELLHEHVEASEERLLVILVFKDELLKSLVLGVLMLLVEQILGFGYEKNIVRFVVLMNVLASGNQVSHGVVVADELQLDGLLHVADEVLELGVAQLVQVESEGQFLVQVLRQLGQRDSVLRLAQDFDQGVLHNHELCFHRGDFAGSFAVELELLVLLLLVLVDGLRPHDQRLVVADNVLVDRVLDELRNLSEREFSEGFWAANLDELRAPVPSSGDGPDVAELVLLAARAIALGRILLLKAVGVGSDPLRLLLLALLAEVILQELLQVLKHLLLHVRIFQLHGVHADPQLLLLQADGLARLAHLRRLGDFVELEFRRLAFGLLLEHQLLLRLDYEVLLVTLPSVLEVLLRRLLSGRGPEGLLVEWRLPEVCAVL